jgi:hypothetical protein
MLLVEEYFASGDPRFVEEVLRIRKGKPLAGLAEKWLRDPRPWSRDVLRAWLLEAFGEPEQKPLLKRLFKAAETAGDDRVMGEFAVALDRSVRRQSEHWPHARRPRYGTFTVHTRYYLRRRAWRYFRRLGFRDPKRYLEAVRRFLPAYADADGGLHFLDHWTLVHALFHHSDVVRPRADAWVLRDQRALRELKPAPAFPKAWEAAGGEPLFELLAEARARSVRRWALAMLKARPELLQKIPFDRLIRLLEHADDEMQALGLELLGSAAGLESVPLETWTRLLGIRNLAVLEGICDVVRRVVAPDRLPLEQLFAFATAPVGPLAGLGIDWLRQRGAPAAALVELSRVQAPSAAAAAVALARERMSADPGFDPAWLLAFLDAPVRQVREAAWAWFGEEKRARHRLDLWAKLVETPYDDVRIGIVGHLERFASIDTALRVLLARAPLETVWATVLLDIHRGNRAKRLAASQIADAVERDPSRAGQLLPLLAVAARSIRAPEFRAGLAAVVRTAVRRPEVAAELARHFPELRLAP